MTSSGCRACGHPFGGESVRQASSPGGTCCAPAGEGGNGGLHAQEGGVTCMAEVSAVIM
jgi:hypothetical protein